MRITRVSVVVDYLLSASIFPTCRCISAPCDVTQVGSTKRSDVVKSVVDRQGRLTLITTYLARVTCVRYTYMRRWRQSEHLLRAKRIWASRSRPSGRVTVHAGRTSEPSLAKQPTTTKSKEAMQPSLVRLLNPCHAEKLSENSVVHAGRSTPLEP